jgi:hypothetical protein
VYSGKLLEQINKIFFLMENSFLQFSFNLLFFAQILTMCCACSRAKIAEIILHQKRKKLFMFSRNFPEHTKVFSENFRCPQNRSKRG